MLGCRIPNSVTTVKNSYRVLNNTVTYKSIGEKTSDTFFGYLFPLPLEKTSSWGESPTIFTLQIRKGWLSSVTLKIRPLFQLSKPACSVIDNSSGSSSCLFGWFLGLSSENRQYDSQFRDMVESTFLLFDLQHPLIRDLIGLPSDMLIGYPGRPEVEVVTSSDPRHRTSPLTVCAYSPLKDS